MDKKDILSKTENELLEDILGLHEKPFRAEQIFSWLHDKRVLSFDEMTNIPKDLRQKLNDNFVIFALSIEKKLVSEYDDTVKYLFKTFDGEFIESVVMRYKYGFTICVSTQIGCRMGCRFCASTLEGVVRSLHPSEILSQIYLAEKDLGVRISRTVLMGMGEPLDNFDNVVRFIELVTNERGQNMSARHISLSTCGIVPKMYDLADMNLQITLSVSLHAPDDETRNKIMPVNKRWSVDELLEASRYYANKTGRRVSFEYAMIKNVNDRDESARLLARKLKNILCHINLIPINEVKETQLKRSDRERIESFSSILRKNGYSVTVRRKLGSDINASCGQLRRKREGNAL